MFKCFLGVLFDQKSWGISLISRLVHWKILSAGMETNPTSGLLVLGRSGKTCWRVQSCKLSWTFGQVRLVLGIWGLPKSHCFSGPAIQVICFALSVGLPCLESGVCLIVIQHHIDFSHFEMCCMVTWLSFKPASFFKSSCSCKLFFFQVSLV